MKDDEGRIIYVGKAKDIRKRVKTYFRKDYAHSTRTRKLVEQTCDIECMQTDSELEAIILETNLIKELRPKYNILMKDDKSYVYIKISSGEDFPRIRVVRERNMEKEGREKGAHYFGPKIASSKVYETLRILKKLFPFRHCNLDIKWKGGTSPQKENFANLSLAPNKELVEVTNRVIDFPCLDYYIKRCPGPCIGAVSPESYKKIVQQIIDFLNGKTEELENALKKEMQEAAEKKLFEKAAKLRDRLYSLQSLTEHQKITDPNRRDTDVINVVSDMGHAYFNVFMIRNGKLIHQENFVLDAYEVSQEELPAELPELIEAFLKQYYEKAADIPKEVLIPEAVETGDTLELWLSKLRGDRVKILVPERGEKNKLLELSYKNALHFSKQYRIKWLADQRGETALARLAEALNMKDNPLKRIEGFDISHLGGNETVGSMVVFEHGLPKSEHYRHFKIRTVSDKPDDYRCMEEVLMRRLKYLVKPKDITVKKATRKDIELIKKWGKQVGWKELFEDPDYQNFLMLLREKKPVGMMRNLLLQKGIYEISALFIIPEERGEKLSYPFLEKVMEKTKDKKARFYAIIEPKFNDHYAEFGFLSVREPPPVVSQRLEFWKTFDQNDSYQVMGYYKTKKKKDDPSFTTKPDLLVIDGGKGQLGAALIALKRLNLQLPVISLAKRLEEVYIPGEKAPYLFEEGDEGLKLLQRIRDESHRFAITFHRELHRKALIPR